MSMLFMPEAVRRQRAAIAEEFQAGKIKGAEAAARLVEIAPDYGASYLVLGNERANADDLGGAESYYWMALERMPCSYSPYLALWEIGQRQNQDNALAARLMSLAFWKLALHETVPEEAAELFEKQLPDAKLDLREPASFEMLALSLERQAGPSGEIDDRLLSYQRLNDIECQPRLGLDSCILDEILEHPERLIPVWRAALRQWANHETVVEPEAIDLMIALLGETAGPEILDELFELLDLGVVEIFPQTNWAIWRQGQRFPAEMVQRVRANAAAARPALRCALAEHLDLLPDTPGIDVALTELLEGFAGFAREEDSGYLLAAVVQALKKRGRVGEAARILERNRSLLSKDGRRWVQQMSAGELTSRLADEGIEGLTIEEICLEDALALPEEDEDDVDDRDEAITPVAAPVRPERNDPCWCGSGKKYKKCHLATDEAAERADDVASGGPPRSLYTALQGALMEWLVKRGGTAEYAEAYQLYFDRLPEEQAPNTSADVMGGFVEWYIHDFRPASTGQTLVEEYLRKRSRRLTDPERELLQSWCDGRFGIWEVQRVESGTGVELENVFEGNRLFVHDVSSSRSMVRWECILSRVHQSGGRWYFTGNGLSVPRAMMPQLKEQVEQESRQAGVSPAAFARANSHRWHRVIKELARERLDGLRVVNAEGDDIVFSMAEYRIDDEAELIAALEAAEAFEREPNDEAGGDCFSWLEAGREEARRSYGRVEIRNGRVRLECNSRRRLDIGRELLEKLGGGRLAHVADSFKSVEALKREAVREKPRQAEGPRLPPEAEREIILKLKAEHYAGWADHPLPALGGRTPREASRSEAGRRALEDLLRTMENSEERTGREGGTAFDFTPIRKSLGMYGS